MQKHGTTLLIVLAAALLLAASASTVPAQRLALTNDRAKIVFPELTISDAEASIGVSCRVTLEGTFASRTISKVRGTLIARIGRAAIGEETCTGGSARVLSELLPIHRKYRGFKGILPRIAFIEETAEGAGFLVSVFGQTCLYRTEEAEPMILSYEREEGEVLTGVTASGSIRKQSGGILCPSRGTVAGRATITESNSTTRLSIRLVR